MRKPTPVVHPDWIVQSIEQRELLPVGAFLYQGFVDPTQSRLLSHNNILHLTASSTSSALAWSSPLAAEPPTPVSVTTTPVSSAAPVALPLSSGAGVLPRTTSGTTAAVAALRNNNDDDAVATRLEYPDTEEIEDDDEESERTHMSDNDDDVQLVDVSSVPERANSAHDTLAPPAPAARESTLSSSSSSTSLARPEDDHASAVDAAHRHPTSTRDGPAAFVRHFFAKSRLHHIGSWRTTFQQRAQEFLALYKGAPIVREPPTSTRRVILHVDMDCFFVSVAVRDRPDLARVPVAVAHSQTTGSSEISSCNYLARAKGVCAGMFMQAAKTLCPDLVVLPYQFDAIACVSLQIYAIFFQHTPYVQAMSCDEALLEFAADTDGVARAEAIRTAIAAATDCCASVGVSYNVLLAKLASKRAKPDGVFAIASPAAAEPFLRALAVRELPGVGRRMSAKLAALGLTVDSTVDALRAVSKTALARVVGATTSALLYDFARGVDHRPLALEATLQRKSVSAVVNFGIRFETWDDAVAFVQALAQELESRLHTLAVRTSCVTLLIKKRRDGAPVESAKYMGHGVCDNFSKTHVLAAPTDDAHIVSSVCIELLRQLRIKSSDLRGVGIQATKLVSATAAGATTTKARALLATWLREPSARAQQPETPVSVPPATAATRDEAPRAIEIESDDDDGEAGVGEEHEQEQAAASATSEDVRAPCEQSVAIGLSQVNMSVLRELPSWIQDEVLSTYRPHSDASGRRMTTTSTNTSSASASSMPQRHDPLRLVRPPTSSATARANGKKPLRKPRTRVGVLTSRSGVSHTRIAPTPGADVGSSSALDDIRMSQIDSDVYDALPFALRREIDRYAKKSTRSGASSASGAGASKPKSASLAPGSAHNTNDSESQAPPPLKRLQSIEELFASVLAAVHASADAHALLSSQSEAFDAIYSRILLEVESRALDRALRMLRYVRRKCAGASASHDDSSGAILASSLRNSFNRVLEQVNRDVQQHFHGVLALAAVAPL